MDTLFSARRKRLSDSAVGLRRCWISGTRARGAQPLAHNKKRPVAFGRLAFFEDLVVWTGERLNRPSKRMLHFKELMNPARQL